MLKFIILIPIYIHVGNKVRKRVNMGFEVILSGFVDYLTELNNENKDNNPTQTEYSTDNENLCAFQYAGEFKEYLAQKNITDYSVFTKSVDSIMSMKVVDGVLVEDKEEDNKEIQDALDVAKEDEALEAEKTEDDAEVDEKSDEATEEIDKETELSESEESEETEEDYDENNLLIDMLNFALNEETIKQILDTDESGELDEDEIHEFLETLVDEEGNITFDILADAIMNQVEEYNEESAKKDEDDDAESMFSTLADNNLANANAAQNTTNTPVQAVSTPTATPNYGVNPTSSGGSYSPAVNSGVSPSSAAAQQPQGLAGMNLEQLQQVKAEREGKVEQARQSLNDAYSGDSLSSELKEEYEAAQADYMEKLEKDSSELKDEQEQCFIASEEAESKISSTNVAINKIQSQIDDMNDTISDDDTTINALKEALNQLNQTNGGNQQAEINQKKEDIQARLNEAREQKDAHKEALEKLEENKGKQQEALLSYENARTESLDAQSDIESKIKETCSAGTKEAYNTFKEIKESIEKAKEKAIEQAKAELVEAQEALSEVNEVIKEKKTQTILSENRVAISGQIIDMARQYVGAEIDGTLVGGGQVNGWYGVNDAGKEVFSKICADNNFSDLPPGGWCYNFVKMIVDKLPADQQPDWYRNSSDPGKLWNAEARAHTIDIKDAKPGDVIIYDWGDNNSVDHIGFIVDPGDGSGNNIVALEGNTSHQDSGNLRRSYVVEKTRNAAAENFSYVIISMH